MGAAARMTFHEWLSHRNDLFWNLAVGVNSANPNRWKVDPHDGNVYTWRPGQDGEQTYDFGTKFPFGDRELVDRREGYSFALYEHHGGKGEFEPIGDPEDN